ncbi:purine phosphorylase [Lentzea sp. NBRC 105346]|uniref:5'-methylthioadenosine/S-adenosylhomocysteine nucleosidase family protein n=1 Tax=Lentzea sp. NBRC 105346 TaxID=3032205 RepID=UPI0024A0E301|nr:5'-methylthioadenosine/S-adenosylhomocysteine nucleosidase [Lentzea sp. NBRC 105346]GLZ35104.1 purine phosphorylase [Lentzea sp. NBRC 105346]
MNDNAVVMLTALNLEYQAVRRRLVDPQVHVHERGTRFEVGTLRGTHCRVVLGLTGKGNHSAAVLAERAIQCFKPTAVLFVGVAGALWGTPLGDVVVATHVYAYHGGTSEDDGLKARPRVWEIAHEIAQLAAHIGRTGDWADDTNTNPNVHFGAIAAGEIVQNSRISSEARWIREHFNDALAIEMEAAGVAQAGHLSGAPVAIIRGISDRADGTKDSAGDTAWQPVAAANAAAFAVRLAAELMGQQEEHAMREAGEPKHHGNITNIASGMVGIQAARVTGSTVVMGGTPQAFTAADLERELAVFRDALARSRSAGQLDDGTYAAATAELDIASTALKENVPERQSKVVLALKRLRGLIAEVAELATKIGTLIAAANGLS